MENKDRTERLVIQVSPIEKGAIIAAARKAGMTTSAYVRHLLLGGEFVINERGERIAPIYKVLEVKNV